MATFHIHNHRIIFSWNGCPSSSDPRQIRYSLSAVTELRPTQGKWFAHCNGITAHNRKSVGYVEKNEGLEGLGWHTMESAEEAAWTPDFLPPDAMCFSSHQDHEIFLKTYAVCLIEKPLGFHNRKVFDWSLEYQDSQRENQCLSWSLFKEY